MKYAAILAIVVTTVALAVGPASSSKMEPCSGEHLTEMTTVASRMRDGPHKWEMYKHLEMINSAMAKDGLRGCVRAVKTIMRGSKVQMMSGM